MSCLKLISCLAIAITTLFSESVSAAELSVERKDNSGAVVRIDGELFCEYRTDLAHQPAIWPIFGPTGVPMTRSYPLGPLREHEMDDHPHHHSFWFAHGDVNGHDFWVSPRSDHPHKIAHREFVRLESSGSEAVISARNDWIAEDRSKICEDERTFVFGVNGNARWIDATIELKASEGDMILGDTKEGTFSVRVAGSMKTEAGLGGQIVNSCGSTNKKAWGEPAEWVDYHGPVDGETVGIAIFSHPSNFRHPCRWHVRTYGLFAANPFGERDFEKADIEQGAVHVAAGESLMLRYRVLLHRGDTNSARIAEAFDEYRSQP